MINFRDKKEKAENIYKRFDELRCPYFVEKVSLTSGGFHHLQFSGQRERTKKAQLLKFKLLPLALAVIQKSGTIQEYRTTMQVEGRRYSRSKSQKMKTVEYWGLVAIVSEAKIKIKVILRKVGNGKLHFWSVMPHGKLGGTDNHRRLYTSDMEND